MELNSQSKQSDALGNLYRSALFMVKGQTSLSLSFLRKAHDVLKDKLSTQVVDMLKRKEILAKEQQFFWAEKILDQYHVQKCQTKRVGLVM